MNKITFLFGAGASRKALPIIREIPQKITALIQELNNDEYILDSNSSFDEARIKKTKREVQLEMLEYLSWLADASTEHDSVDTFAKKLFIKRNADELKKLKIALSVFFVCEQAINKPDTRYDSFFASILKSLSNLPDNIKILTWNYDYQFELSFSNYNNQDDLVSLQDYLGVHSKFFEKSYSRGFRIYKLNGTIGLFENRYQYYHFVNKIKKPFDKNFVEEITKNFAYAVHLNNLKLSLSFAWENEYLDDGIKVSEIAADDVKDSTALVVIGYSFPFFNREIDRKIIGSMTNLKRVYFQAPDADTLKERFQAIRDDLKGIELITKYDTEQFLLPNEL